MPLFNCSKCGVVENTALGAYWLERARGEPTLCSECSTGAWHGSFPKSYEPIEHNQSSSSGGPNSKCKKWLCGFCRAEYPTFQEAADCRWKRHGERKPLDQRLLELVIGVRDIPWSPEPEQPEEYRQGWQDACERIIELWAHNTVEDR